MLRHSSSLITAFSKCFYLLGLKAANKSFFLSVVYPLNESKPLFCLFQNPPTHCWENVNDFCYSGELCSFPGGRESWGMGASAECSRRASRFSLPVSIWFQLTPLRLLPLCVSVWVMLLCFTQRWNIIKHTNSSFRFQIQHYSYSHTEITFIYQLERIFHHELSLQNIVSIEISYCSVRLLWKFYWIILLYADFSWYMAPSQTDI